MERLRPSGNSQSEVNDTSRNRVLVPLNARQVAVVIGRQVEIVHRPRDRQVRIGVEALHEGAALVAQIAFDLEHLTEQADRLGRVFRRVLQPPAEFPRQRLFGQIGDVRAHPRHRQAARRHPAGLPVAPAQPIGIGEDRLPPDLMEGDVLRRVIRGARRSATRRTPHLG